MTREIGWIWKDTGWWVKPKSAREVMTLVGSIGVYSTGQHFAWRGVSSADYQLRSSLQRSVGDDEVQVRAAEQSLLASARAWGLGVQPSGHVDDLQLLSDLQHYGIATRLLDFTSNPMTALWFACQAPKASGVSKSGLLLALNITGWPHYSTVRGPNPGSYSELERPTTARLEHALSQGVPFVVDSANPNERLRAQEGFFVSGHVPDHHVRKVSESMTITDYRAFSSFEMNWKPTDPAALTERLMSDRRVGAPENMPFVAVVITAGLKAKLLRYLEGTFNRSARVLFPDYAGFLEFGQEALERENVT